MNPPITQLNPLKCTMLNESRRILFETIKDRILSERIGVWVIFFHILGSQNHRGYGENSSYFKNWTT